MTLNRLALVLLPLVLWSCAPVCTSPAARELRTVDALITETRENLARGYSRAPRSAGSVNLCLGGADNGVGLSFCTDARREGRAVPIDVAAERRKLAALEARAAMLRAQAAQELAACSNRGS